MAKVPFFPPLRFPGDQLVAPKLAANFPFRDSLAGAWRLPYLVDAHRGLRMTLLANAPEPVGPQGMRFDLTARGATIPITLSAAPYTIAVWYTPNNTASQSRRCVQAASGGTNWLMGPYGTQFQVYNGGFIAGSTITRFPVVQVVTDDGTTCTQYVNGLSSGTPRATGTHPGALGIGKGQFNESAESDIKNLMVWTRVLTATEVAQLPANPDLMYRPRAYGFMVNTDTATAFPHHYYQQMRA